MLEDKLHLGNAKKNEFSFGISLDLHYLCTQKIILLVSRAEVFVAPQNNHKTQFDNEGYQLTPSGAWALVVYRNRKGVVILRCFCILLVLIASVSFKMKDAPPVIKCMKTNIKPIL